MLQNGVPLCSGKPYSTRPFLRSRSGVGGRLSWDDGLGGLRDQLAKQSAMIGFQCPWLLDADVSMGPLHYQSEVEYCAGLASQIGRRTARVTRAATVEG